MKRARDRDRGGFASEGAAPVTPNMQTVVASCCGDLDATVSASYASGATWLNLVTAPADGTAQTAYDFTINGATFSANEFLLDGGDWFTIANGNTPLINNWHKTTGGNPVSIAMVVSVPPRVEGSFRRSFFGNYGRVSSNHGIAFADGNDYGGVFNAANIAVCGGSYNAEENLPAVVTCTGSYLVLVFTYRWTDAGEWKVYAGSSTPNVGAELFISSTTNASLPLQFGANGGGNSPMNNGSKIKAVSIYNAELTDANVTAIRAEYSSRHGASY